MGMQIGRKLRDEITHINWIDLTMNDFDKYYEEDTKPIKEGENRGGRIGRDAKDPRDSQIIQAAKEKQAIVNTIIAGVKR